MPHSAHAIRWLGTKWPFWSDQLGAAEIGARQHLAVLLGNLAMGDIPELNMPACILCQDVPPVQQACTAYDGWYTKDGSYRLRLLWLWKGSA